MRKLAWGDDNASNTREEVALLAELIKALA